MKHTLGQNTGIIIGQHINEYVLGANSPIVHEVRNSNRDWRIFRSRDERQNMNPEDRMYCVTGSATNIWEQQANWMLANNLWPEDALKFWNENGYILNGKFEIARRFTAKMSGTTRQGNYFFKVWDSIRKDGVVPDSKWPDDKDLDWDEYYKDILHDLIVLGLQSLKYFSLLYEQVTGLSKQAMLKAQELAPLQVGISTGCGWDSEVAVCNLPVNHAVDNDHIRTDLSCDIFDSYDPFSKHLAVGYPILICYRAVLYPVKRNQPIAVTETFKKDIVFNEASEEVLKLRKALSDLGWQNQVGWNVYNQELAEVVYKFQLANVSHVFWEMITNLRGKRVGAKTREVLNNYLTIKK